MANLNKSNIESSEAPQPKKRFIAQKLPLIIIACIFAVVLLNQAGYIKLPHISVGNVQVQDKDPFVGSWVTLSPTTYYGKDVDGERYVEYTANFHLYNKQEGKGYLANGWLTEVSYKAVPGAITPIAPLVQNPDGGYYSPLSFDARGYLAPQPGISSLEKAGNKMTVTTPLFGGTEKIVLTLVESGKEFGQGDKLYATLSIIPTASGQSMGEETDTPIVLVRE